MRRDRIAIGDQFGRWQVVGRSGSVAMPSGGTKPVWSCRCSCGVVKNVKAEHLKSGRSQSCGCFRSESATLQKTTHGLRDHELYDVWTSMHQRCSNPNNSHYHLYGGRGVTVCQEWHNFARFVGDMGQRPQDGTIERKDNDGGYEPANCRWASAKEQARNQRKTCRVEWGGRHVALADLSESRGIKLHTAWARLNRRGWTVGQAIGAEPPPRRERPAIGEVTRQRMSAAAKAIWQARRERFA